MKLYDPAASPVTVYGSAIPLAFPEAVPVQLKSPVPEPATWIEPVAEPHETGSVVVPDAIVGVGTTVIVVIAEVDTHPFPSV